MGVKRLGRELLESLRYRLQLPLQQVKLLDPPFVWFEATHENRELRSELFIFQGIMNTVAKIVEVIRTRRRDGFDLSVSAQNAEFHRVRFSVRRQVFHEKAEETALSW